MQNRSKENRLLSEFISAVFSFSDSRKETMGNCIVIHSRKIYFLSRKGINVILSITKDPNTSNLDTLQILETLDYIHMKFIEKFPYIEESSKHQPKTITTLIDGFSQEIDVIFGLSAIQQEEWKFFGLINLLNNQSNYSTVVKRIISKFGRSDPELSHIIQSSLDDIEPLIDEFYLSDIIRRELKKITLELRRFTEFDDWLSRL
jgi:hypothetical protein